MSTLTDRWIEPFDIHLLEMCLERDPHHTETKVEFFFRPGTVTKVYEDEDGPVLFIRGEAVEHEGEKILRLDVQYVDNEANERNRMAMLDGFPKLVGKAKSNGFTQVLFFTNSRPLSIFCKRELGFKEVAKGELRKYL